jgi:hypothetical protein
MRSAAVWRVKHVILADPGMPIIVHPATCPRPERATDRKYLAQKSSNEMAILHQLTSAARVSAEDMSS